MYRKIKWVVGWKYKNGWLNDWKKLRDVRKDRKRLLDRWLNRKTEKTKQMDGQMDRRETDGRLDAQLVGGWVDRDKNGWLNG